MNSFDFLPPMKDCHLMKLPEEVLVHIMEFCSGQNLLALSETCKTFKNMIFNETKLMKKIQLKIEIDKGNRVQSLSSDASKKIAEERKISAVKLFYLNSIDVPEETNDATMLNTLKHLSCATDLFIQGYRWLGYSIMDRLTFNEIMRLFLPKLKNLEIRGFILDEEHVNDTLERLNVVPVTKGFNFPLDTLTMHQADSRILIHLSSCLNLTKFTYDENECDHLPLDAPRLIKDFLMRQRDLKVLHIARKVMHRVFIKLITDDWVQMPFLLHKLTISGIKFDQEATIAQLLTKQKQLKSLSIDFEHSPSRQLMKAICGLPALTEFQCDRWLSSTLKATEEELEALDGLSNQTVTSVTMKKCSILTGKFCSIFEATDMILVHGGNIGNVLHQQLEKIAIITINTQLDYRPRFPDCRQSFESDVLKFIERNSQNIHFVSIEVEHREGGFFEFSHEFCKALYKCLPHLKTLSLSSIEKLEEFHEFMLHNYPRIDILLG